MANFARSGHTAEVEVEPSPASFFCPLTSFPSDLIVSDCFVKRPPTFFPNANNLINFIKARLDADVWNNSDSILGP